MAILEEPLQEIVATVTGARAVRLQPVGGGCIHTASQVVTANGRSLFLKRNRPELLPVLASEADGLAALRAAGSPLVIPAPHSCGVSGGQAALLMDWLELQGASGWDELGRGLALLHRRGGGDRYGWCSDNFIGSSPQRNAPMDCWGPFFAKQRLQPQFAMATARGVAYPAAAELLAAVPGWLATHDAPPCLVHGDLWSGNAGMTTSGRGCLFDPAVHYADREVDIAMARLFGGFPSRFFSAYEREWPLPPGHQQRCKLYNLYHLLNHANLFGGGYARQSEACMAELLAAPPRW